MLKIHCTVVNISFARYIPSTKAPVQSNANNIIEITVLCKLIQSQCIYLQHQPKGPCYIGDGHREDAYDPKFHALIGLTFIYLMIFVIKDVVWVHRFHVWQFFSLHFSSCLSCDTIPIEILYRLNIEFSVDLES